MSQQDKKLAEIEGLIEAYATNSGKPIFRLQKELEQVHRDLEKQLEDSHRRIEELKISNKKHQKTINDLSNEIKELEVINNNLKAEKNILQQQHKNMQQENKVLKYDIGMSKVGAMQTTDGDKKNMHQILTLVSILGTLIAILIIIFNKK